MSDKKKTDDIIGIEEKQLQDDCCSIVSVGTNRWSPDRCMWTCAKRLLRDDVAVVFPFPDLAESICHVLIGTSQSHVSFIHLTPLTSLFRRSTDELEKIHANISLISDESRDWRFRVFYFEDGGNELKFRNIISKVLGKRNVIFIAMRPKGYETGKIDLVYRMGAFSWSKDDAKSLMARKDASSIGSYNGIPIYAYE